jgi:hypothetical protein
MNPFTALNTTAFAPMATAIVSTAVIVKLGDLRSRCALKRTSRMNVSMKLPTKLLRDCFISSSSRVG